MKLWETHMQKIVKSREIKWIPCEKLCYIHAKINCKTMLLTCELFENKNRTKLVLRLNWSNPTQNLSSENANNHISEYSLGVSYRISERKLYVSLKGSVLQSHMIENQILKIKNVNLRSYVTIYLFDQNGTKFVSPLSFLNPPRPLANQLLLEKRKSATLNFFLNILFNTSSQEKVKCDSTNISNNKKIYIL